MSDQHALYLVTQEGEVVGRRPDLQQALERIEELEQAIQDIEKDLRGKRAYIKRLLASIAQDRDNYDRKEEVVSIFREWTEKCGKRHARLTDDRFDAVRALLEVSRPNPYPREAFSRAIDGAAYDPFITRRKNGSQKRHDDLLLICKDGKTFEDFIKRAPKNGAVILGKPREQPDHPF